MCQGTNLAGKGQYYLFLMDLVVAFFRKTVQRIPMKYRLFIQTSVSDSQKIGLYVFGIVILIIFYLPTLESLCKIWQL